MTFSEIDSPSCENGSLPHNVYGCDFDIPPELDCPDGEQFNFNGSCNGFEQVLVPRSAAPVEFAEGSLVEETSGSADLSIFEDLLNRNNELTSDSLGELETLNGTASELLDCLKNEGDCNSEAPDNIPYDKLTARDGFDDAYLRLTSAPLLNAVGNVVDLAPTGAGTCPKPSFSTFGDSFTIDLHCELYSSVAPVISAVMMFFVWPFLGWRRFSDNW
jgi:hypothetical protein